MTNIILFKSKSMTQVPPCRGQRETETMETGGVIRLINQFVWIYTLKWLLTDILDIDSVSNTSPSFDFRMLGNYKTLSRLLLKLMRESHSHFFWSRLASCPVAIPTEEEYQNVSPWCSNWLNPSFLLSVFLPLLHWPKLSGRE